MADWQDLAPGFLADVVLPMCAEAGVSPDDAIESGYRSSERQAQLYNCYLVKRRTGICRCPADGCNPANPPGRSQHEFGEAVDWARWIVPTMRAIAAKYGGIFPIPGESWHMERRNKGAPPANGSSRPTRKDDSAFLAVAANF